MTIIPIVLVTVSGIIYLAKYKITESKYAEICKEIASRKAEANENAEEITEASSETLVSAEE